MPISSFLFFFVFFVVAHPFSSNSPLLVSLSTHFLEDHCPSRWRCEIFNSLLLSGGQYTLADGPSPHRPQCMQISIQSRPGCFQYNTSAAGPVLIPLYQQPMHCFIQSNALSTMSTWTSGHITEAQKKLKKKKKITWLMRVWKKVSLWKVQSLDKGDKVHADDLQYCCMQSSV